LDREGPAPLRCGHQQLGCSAKGGLATLKSINNLNATSTSLLSSISNLNETSTTLFNKTNFSSYIISGNSTLLLSLNISGSTNQNYIFIKGNLNVGGTTTIADTVINNTSFSSLSVSGPSIYYSNITLVSSLNVIGIS
jgi:hypothetical protein